MNPIHHPLEANQPTTKLEICDDRDRVLSFSSQHILPVRSEQTPFSPLRPMPQSVETTATYLPMNIS